ncbi:hypothetical protein [Rhizobium sp. CECT 9324]|uniref:hypothetical protein n=1 Tax=Rhizobium sp. CECT 9324 TaxID=2845820 RepID=UPI001E325DE6|nr:hypothetical protein [Rhizobium sp. CECT 9324]
MSMVPYKKMLQLVQRYVAFVQRAGDYRLLGSSEKVRHLALRDFGLSERSPEAIPPLAVEAKEPKPSGGSHAAFRSGDGTPRGRGLAVRIYRTGSRA